MAAASNHSSWNAAESPDNTTTHSSKQDGRRQHHRQAVTGIQPTSTRQRRTVPSNTDGTNQNTESPITTKLPQDNHQQASNRTMAGTTHSASTLPNRYATHADGNTSYFHRWNKDHRTPLCEFGETAQYLLPTVKQLPKMEQHVFKAIWLGRDTATGETLLGISNKAVRARTIRRMPKADKYDSMTNKCLTSSAEQDTP